jgi:glycosyltransferase involved in cell wall biosynthesis
MPRVLVLCEHPTLNGGERSLLAVLPTIQRAGWEVEAFCPPTGPLAEAFTQIGVRVCLPSPRRGEAPEVRGESLRELLSQQRYDLVHANSLSTARHSGPIVAASGLPSIGHLRDIVGLKSNAVADLNRHTRLLAVSQATRDFHVAQGVAADKLYVVHNGIDLKVWSPSPLAGEGLGVRGDRVESDKQTIAVIGQIILRKGQDIALAAAIETMRARPNVEVVVLGARHSEKLETCEYERCLHERVAAAGMTERIQFLGTRTDVAQRLPACTMLLHTPRQEPLGRVLIEAAACGVPVVATDVGGTREIFPQGAADGALLIPVDDVTAASAALARILDDGDLHRRLAVGGRARAVAAFSVEQAAANLLRHYHEVSGVPASSTIAAS